MSNGTGPPPGRKRKLQDAYGERYPKKRWSCQQPFHSNMELTDSEGGKDFSYEFTLKKASESRPELAPHKIGRETDSHRLGQRQKQIDKGKNTRGYDRYREQVPKSKRNPKCDPITPDKYQLCSKRSWGGQVSKWRRMLHFYDPPDEEGEDAEEVDLDTFGADDGDIEIDFGPPNVDDKDALQALEAEDAADDHLHAKSPSLQHTDNAGSDERAAATVYDDDFSSPLATFEQHDTEKMAVKGATSAADAQLDETFEEYEKRLNASEGFNALDESEARTIYDDFEDFE